jgi:Histidine kinase-, DNA gyrase B-, and HSP90-like ATPase
LKVEDRVLHQESTIEGESFDLSIDAADMPFVMGILTNLYSDRLMAVLREYSTNARDANIQAGNGHLPIKVTLPTTLAPQLRIKDQGIGLDQDDIRNIYSKYGASTKRDSNDFTGQLGLGCKSALTYTDQFTVTAIKDGMKSEVQVSRTEEGGGKMHVVDEYETDEPNGVEIIVPIARQDISYACKAKADELFSYWEKGTVLVNDEEPQSITEDAFKVSDDLYVIHEAGKDRIVMGGVAYPFTGYHGYRNYSIIAFVPIGSVAFTPAREELLDNKKTVAYCEELIERFKVEINAAVTRSVEEAPNRREALLKFNQVSNLFSQQVKIEATYKGKKIPGAFENVKDGMIVVQPTSRKSYRSKGWSRDHRYPSSVWPNTIWITGYPGADFSPFKRKKMDQWREEKGLAEPTNYVFTQKTPHRSWLDPNMIFPWAEIEAQKITVERNVNQNGRPTGSYTGYVDGDFSYGLKADEINVANPIFYFNKTYNHLSHRVQAMITKEHPQHTIVELSSNRVKKFKRDFPNAIEVNEYAKEKAETWAATLTDDDKLWLKIQDEMSSRLNLLKDVVVDDPDLSKAIELANKSNAKLEKEAETHSGWASSFITNVEWENPADKYELLQHLSIYGTLDAVMTEHVTLYINAAYAAEGEGA